MSLQCQLTLSRLSTSVGQSPAPMLLLQVYNPNASAVVVTAVQVTFWDTVGQQLRQAPVANIAPPVGPGLPASVSALSSIYIGPFPMQVHSAAFSAASNQTPPFSQPPNMQGSQPQVFNMVIGALVTGSDGSVNEAGRVQLRVAPAVKPYLHSQGGVAQFGGKRNSNLVAAVVG